MTYLFNSKLSRGFSLIELMVVMAIMAVLMSLSGGLMQKSINQQTRQVELEQIQQIFKRLSYRAYYGGTSIMVRLEKNQMFISFPRYAIDVLPNEQNLNENENVFIETRLVENEAQIEQIDFEQLTFVAEDYTISTKGIINPNIYGIFWQEDIKQFSLKSLFSDVAL